MTKKLAFIGLGVMGYEMAGHLSKAGYDMVVYNRSAQKALAWQSQYKGEIAATPAEAAKGCDVVFACVGNDDDLKMITMGANGAFAAMKAGAIFVDHTTASASMACKLAAKAEEMGLSFMDAPVSGGQDGAKQGALSVMCGGRKDVYDEVAVYLSHYGAKLSYLGKSGNGQLCKMVNQICQVGIVQSLAEGLAFAQKAGLDGSIVLGAIANGASASWQMDHRGHTMLAGEFDFGFAVDLMRKDLGLCLAQAQQNQAVLPVAALIDQLYAQRQNEGDGRLDTSSLIKNLL